MVDDNEIVLVEDEEEDILSESDSLVIKLVNNILISAASRGASDIHFETRCKENQTCIRFRIDGICHDVYSISSFYERALIKILHVLTTCWSESRISRARIVRAVVIARCPNQVPLPSE